MWLVVAYYAVPVSEAAIGLFRNKTWPLFKENQKGGTINGQQPPSQTAVQYQESWPDRQQEGNDIFSFKL